MSLRCRTCFEVLNNGSQYFKLDGNEPSNFPTVIKSRLDCCVPELTLNIVENPLICTTCVDALCDAYNFKKRCLETEKKIYEYVFKQHLKDDSVDINTVVKWIEIQQTASNNKETVDASQAGNSQADVNVISNDGGDDKYNCQNFINNRENSQISTETHEQQSAPTKNGISKASVMPKLRKSIKKPYKYNKNVIQYRPKKRRNKLLKQKKNSASQLLKSSLVKQFIQQDINNINIVSSSSNDSWNSNFEINSVVNSEINPENHVNVDFTTIKMNDLEQQKLENVDRINCVNIISGITCQLEDFSEFENKTVDKFHLNEQNYENESSADKRYKLRNVNKASGYYRNQHVRKYKERLQPQANTNLKHTIHRCKICGFSSFKKELVLHHAEEHIQGKTNNIDFEETSTKEIDSSSANLPYVCESCDNKTNNIFSTYMFNCGEDNSCYFCEYKASNIQDLYKHIAENHSSLCNCMLCNNPGNLDDVLMDWYNEFSKANPSKEKLKLHHARKHREAKVFNTNLPYVCESCDNKTNNIFSTYMFNCGEQNTCYFCEFSALDTQQLYKHIADNHSSLCSCMLCNSSGNLEDVLINWYNNVSDADSYRCSKCNIVIKKSGIFFHICPEKKTSEADHNYASNMV